METRVVCRPFACGHRHLLIIETVWWLVFMTAVGLTVGSFLNVVIYRLPLGQSVLHPTMSHCPTCGAGIRWYDNLPVISYLRLGGRCRDCRADISIRYPIVELLFALVVLLLVDAFCVAHVRTGLIESRPGLTWQIVEDGPLLAAHVILFAALLAMSAIDMEHYWVDVRATNLAVGCGFILHALWTPRRFPSWPRPDDETALICIGILVGLALTAIILRLCYGPTNGESDIDGDPSDEPGSDPPTVDLVDSPPAPENEPSISSAELSAPADPDPTPTAEVTEPSAGGRTTVGGLLLPGMMTLFLVVLLAGAAFDGTGGPNWLPFPVRALGILILLFVIMVVQAAVVRESDQEIFDAIESERHGARRMSMIEFGRLSPGLVGGAVMALVIFSPGGSLKLLEGMLHWPATNSWRPVEGLGTAAAGFIIGGGIGWSVRLIFTLILGKEAFGTGDIHLLAAAGCVAGWPVALGGFVIACLLALVAIVVALPFKRTRTIPLGPWLSLGFLIMVVFYEPIIQSKPIQNLLDVVELLAHGGAY